MLLKIFLLLFIVSPMASAAELKIRDGFKNYTLTYSQNQVSFKGKGMNLSLEKKPCNQHIVEKFTKQIELMQKRAVKKPHGQKGDLQLSQDGKTTYLSATSSAGKYFSMIPREIKRMKVEESLQCKNSVP